MSLIVRQFPCLQDNYGFLARDEATGQVACIDTPDAAAVLRELDVLGWSLTLIMNTHWHPDHAGGNAEIKAATGATIVGPAEVTRIAPLDREVSHGDVVELGETRFSVIDTGGHTLGHISYFDAEDQIAFVGDTLFALGCGRLFEGTAEQMWASLSRLAALPQDVPVVLTGDFNTEPGSDTWRTLTARLHDARGEAAKVEGPRLTFHDFTGKGQLQLDWILLHGFRALDFATLDARPLGLLPSDHFPVMADLRFPAAAAHGKVAPAP